MVNPVELIIKKRNKQTLTNDEIKYFISSYLNNEIPEYQMSALLMAIFLNGMKDIEIHHLAKSYIESGKRIVFNPSMNTVDKHSTGGVGDKISIPLAPIVAACGAKIPMISGRGLGHTGGTLDKLESIPGLRTNFDEKDFKKFINECGFSIIAQSADVVPADKKIYALRDVTGTVDSWPLITASIMSKKIAEGAQNLVVDLKVGSGAFMKTLSDAKELGRLLSSVGKEFGQKVSVVYTDMNSPIGNMIGNALEIRESIEYLKGNKIPDLHILTKTLAIEMLLLSKVAKDKVNAGKMVEQVIDNGKALEVFAHYIMLHGGNPKVCEDVSFLPTAKYQFPIKSKDTGYISAIDSQAIGYALIDVGAGRKTLCSKLNYSSGALLPYKIGDYVNGELGTLFCDNKEIAPSVTQKIIKAYTFSDKKIEKGNIVIGINI